MKNVGCVAPCSKTTFLRASGSDQSPIHRKTIPRFYVIWVIALAFCSGCRCPIEHPRLSTNENLPQRFDIQIPVQNAHAYNFSTHVRQLTLMFSYTSSKTRVGHVLQLFTRWGKHPPIPRNTPRMLGHLVAFRSRWLPLCAADSDHK